MIRTPQILKDVRASSLSFKALLLAIVIYGMFGLPTPNNPGLAEAIIGALLVISVGFAGLSQSVKINDNKSILYGAARLLLFYGCSIPLIIGIFNGFPPSLIVRDIAAFLFMLLPLFVSHHFDNADEAHNKNGALLIYAVVICAFCFAFRANMEVVSDAFSAFLPLLKDAELTYLANAPTLLFSSIFIIGSAFQYYIKQPSFKRFILMALAALAVVIFLLPIIVTVQRATLAYFALAIAALLILGTLKYTYRTFMLVGIIALLSLPLWPLFAAIFELLVHKTALVGQNMRFEELGAVWHEVSQSLLTLLFGLGWGSGFNSPAVADIYVQYAHGLLSSALLKTGLIGLGLTSMYVAAIVRGILPLMQRNIIAVLALLGPILIDCLLYASFKSLDFGLLLLIAIAVNHRAEIIAKAG